MSTKPRATIADLYRVPDDGKAELVDGELVRMSPTGDLPGRAAGAIYGSLRESSAQRVGGGAPTQQEMFEKEAGGRAYPGNVVFRVNLPHRESISPDAAFYRGPRAGMKFLEGTPAFAVEVRSEGDYGPSAEVALAGKRADYFAAGTKVVWDVDLLSDDVIKVYRASAPDVPTVYRRGQIAEAEPAVPRWTFPVDELFE